MANDLSLWHLVGNADPVVKFILLVLLICSIWSWAIILQRALLIKQYRQQDKAFEKEFWAGSDMGRLYQTLGQNESLLQGMVSVFHSGFKEFMKLHKRKGIGADAIIDGINRVMRVKITREADRLENQLAFLATIGSVAPYIGLLGTVWGIMASFTVLGGVEQATLSMVAPHIAEALIATALGLFVAIPAVIAFNRLSRSIDLRVAEFENFQDEFCSIIHREVHTKR
ncbi:protein TolQ [Thiotrichales bacterium 19S9-12]|nr:protein TolQ [Thiotrichales bacterium 19S9-11]MCF6811678.1 protein TolQ [Thiotrichales bacterium 19S9-12]